MDSPSRWVLGFFLILKLNKVKIDITVKNFRKLINVDFRYATNIQILKYFTLPTHDNVCLHVSIYFV